MRVPKITPNLPPFLSSLYDEKYINFSIEDLRRIRVNLSLDNDQIDAVFLHTKDQARNLDWFKFRQGRITASIFKKTCITTIEKPALSTIKLICYPSKMPLKTKQIMYGIKNEVVAKEAYILKMESSNHKGLEFYNPGLVISLQMPIFAASPDGMVSCKCCGIGCMEIKCPFQFIGKTLEEYALLPHTCLVKDGISYRLDRDHEYYYQTQLQIFCTEFDYCDFILWSKNLMFVERIYTDQDFIKSKLTLASEFHKKVIVPELLGKYYTRPKDSPNIVAWCSCCQPQNKNENERMIKCTNELCETQWFHLKCAKSSGTIDEDAWICSLCLEDRAIEEAVLQYD